jgi:GTPase SAR1 family protein
MYDVTKPSSFSNLKTWVEELREHASPHIVVILIGNKTDLDTLRLVPVEVAETFAGASLTPPLPLTPPPPLPFAIRTRNGAAEIVRGLPFGGHLFVQRKTA